MRQTARTKKMKLKKVQMLLKTIWPTVLEGGLTARLSSPSALRRAACSAVSPRPGAGSNRRAVAADWAGGSVFRLLFMRCLPAENGPEYGRFHFAFIILFILPCTQSEHSRIGMPAVPARRHF